MISYFFNQKKIYINSLTKKASPCLARATQTSNTKTIHSCVDMFIFLCWPHCPIAKKIINQLVDHFSFGPNRRSNPLASAHQLSILGPSALIAFSNPKHTLSLGPHWNLFFFFENQVRIGYKDKNPHTHVQPTYT